MEQRRTREGNYQVVERTFYTPAGKPDRTKIAAANMACQPDQDRIPGKVMTIGGAALLLPEVNTNFGFVHADQKLIGDRGVVLVCVRSALDHHAGAARDMQDLMMDYHLDRPFFDELLGIYHQRSLAIARAALEAGVEFIFGSWYFNSLSSGWSPAIFREVFIPQIREHVALTHRYGAYYDYYDDGKLAATMELIADTGVDVIETCTPPPVGDFDLAEAKRRIGDKTTLKGYVDLLYVVKLGTPELIDRTVREAMEIAKPGGFIIGSSDGFRDGTPRENIDAYFDACRKYGPYG